MSRPRTVDDVLRDVDEVTDGLDPMSRIVWLEELAARLESRIDMTAHDQAAALMSDEVVADPSPPLRPSSQDTTEK